jgi:hypothetical protein
VGTARRLFYTGTTDTDVLSALLATAYQTSTSLLLKQHDQGNAWLAVGRAMVRVQAHVLAREKHSSQAVTLVRHTADLLTGPTTAALRSTWAR